MRVSSLIASLILALVALTSFISPARASEPIASLNVETTLKGDGRLKVQQTLQYFDPSALEWTVFGSVSNVHISADGTPLKSFQSQRQAGAQTLTTTHWGTTWQITYELSSALIRHNDRDQMYLKLFDSPGVPVENVIVNFHLPSSVAENQLNANAYAINGNKNPTSTIVAGDTVRYADSFAGAKALFTVSASWPKNVLQLSKWQEWRLSLINLGAIPWLLLGLLLPILTLLVLSSLLWAVRRRERPVTQKISEPPSALSPILVGVLVNKKIYPDEIVALLVDLCQRGYLVIVNKHDQYYLTQRSLPDEHLQNWEREIIDQLFPTFGVTISERSAQMLSGSSIFSPKVRDAFNEIYQVVTQIGAFQENPHLTRVRYKLIALFFYFAALISMGWTVVTNASALLLIPLIGSLFLAYLIIRLSPQLTRYTAEGERERERWQSFGNYLADPTPLGLEAAQNHIYEKYLAYAIALHHSTEWAARFEKASTIITRPDWFVNYEDVGPAELSMELQKFTGVISAEITKLHGPSVG